jgi:hypothetical protein
LGICEKNTAEDCEQVFEEWRLEPEAESEFLVDRQNILLQLVGFG